MRYFILAILALALQAADTPLPPEAAAAVAAYEKACNDAQFKADGLKAEAAKRLSSALEEAQKKATQAGNLDAALAIKARKEEALGSMAASIMGSAPESARISGNVVSRKAADTLLATIPSMTAEDWNKLPGVNVKVIGNARMPARIHVKKGDVYLFVPHPTDKIEGYTYKGDSSRPNWGGYNINCGACCWGLGAPITGDRSDSLLWEAAGDGDLFTQVNYKVLTGRTLETIRFKVFKVQ